MANYRQIHCSIWKDEWFLDLKPDEKLLFIYLFSNESTSLAGIYKIPIRVIAFETGLDIETVKATLDKFAMAEKVYFENGIVWVVNMRSYHETRSPKVAHRIAADIASIPDCKLKMRYLYHINPELYGMDTDPEEEEEEKEKEEEEEYIAAEPQPPEPAEKIRILEAIEKGKSKDSNVKNDIYVYFSITPNWDTKTAKDFVSWVKDRPPDQTLHKFSLWWYTEDWRGKSGAPPNLAQIRELWPQAFKNGAGPPKEFNAARKKQHEEAAEIDRQIKALEKKESP